MKDEPKNKNVVFQSGDNNVFADNTQQKVKTKRVKENGMTPLGIATNVVSIQSNPLSSIQYVESFPQVNQFSQTTDYVNKINDLEKMLNENIFRPHRFMKQQKVFKKVSKEVSFEI